jgi:hypothetical protein
MNFSHLPKNVIRLISEYSATTEIIFPSSCRSISAYNVDTRKFKRHTFEMYCINVFKVGDKIATVHYDDGGIVVYVRHPIKMNIIHTFVLPDNGISINDVVYLTQDIIGISYYELTGGQLMSDEFRSLLLWNVWNNKYIRAEIAVFEPEMYYYKMVRMNENYFVVQISDMTFLIVNPNTGESVYEYNHSETINHIGTNGKDVIFTSKNKIYSYYKKMVTEIPIENFEVLNIENGVVYGLRGGELISMKLNGICLETIPFLCERLTLGMSLKRHGGYLYMGDGKTTYKMDSKTKDVVDEFDTIDGTNYVVISDVGLF